MPTVSAASSVPRNATAVDVPVASDELDSLPEALGWVASVQGFEGKAGQTLVVPRQKASDVVDVLLGIGPRADVSPNVLRTAAAAYVRAVAKHARIATTLVEQLGEEQRDDAIQAVVEGARLATYRFSQYKSKSAAKPTLERVTVVAKGRGVKAAVTSATAIADAVVLARDLSNEPGGSLTPEAFAAKAKLVGTAVGLKVTVWDEKKIAREKLGGLIAVNQGSVHPARFLRLSYTPKAKPKATIALVGKGITFDSGGLSLKTAAGMMQMKIDMSGGGAVLAAMSALPAVGAPVAVEGFIPLTDNMTGGDATRPGDVFTARNGKTVEVLNTDAEGRLVLADALSLAVETKPDVIVDIATLTGSASAALGANIAALMATDDDAADRLMASSGRTAEKIWRLPLPEEYRPQLDSTVADIKNIGAGPYGGALVAGLFLKEFVGSVPWAHIDLGLSAITDADRGITPKGATGFGVRLLVDMCRNWDDE
ncbi:MAG: leucyl aminopeptidase [Actinomycetota bacterium]